MKTSLALVPLFALVTTVSACSSSEGEKASSETSKLGVASFCPKAFVPRKDMARFLERLKHGRDFNPPPAQNLFDDVARDSDDARWIEALYNDGITRGCGQPGKFCPNDPVPREQMAAFIIRLKYGPDFDRGGSSRFEDVVGDSEQFAGYIEQLADDGITTGCDPTHFCPKELVLREQMAAFLMRAAHPGSPDTDGTDRYGDVNGDSEFFEGRIEQAVDDGIMETCEGPSQWKTPFPTTTRFDVFLKSSIEEVNENEHAPYGAYPVYGGAKMTALLWATNQSYREYPSDDWWGAQHDSWQFRLWGYLGIDATCSNGVASQPALPYVYDDGGQEAGPLYGTHHITTAIEQEGAGWAIRFVLWGSPAGILEPQFQSVKSRDNTAIFQYGTVHVGCNGNDPTATFQTYEGPSHGGSSFPTHHAWIFRDQQRLEHFRRGQSWSDDPDGPGMKDLWFLPSVPTL